MAEYLDKNTVLKILSAYDKAVDESADGSAFVDVINRHTHHVVEHLREAIKGFPVADVGPASKWTSVKDKAPVLPALAYLSNGEYYPMTDSYYQVSVFESFYYTDKYKTQLDELCYGAFTYGSYKLNSAMIRKIPHIIYWMPLPVPPKMNEVSDG